MRVLSILILLKNFNVSKIRRASLKFPVGKKNTLGVPGAQTSPSEADPFTFLMIYHEAEIQLSRAIGEADRL